MANDLASTVKTAQVTFYQNVADYSPSWSRLTAPIMMPEDQYTLEEQQTYGASVWEAHSAAPTSQDVKSINHSTTVSDFDFLASRSIPDVKRNPGLLIQDALNAANLAKYTIAEAFWDAVFAAASTAHPYTGTDVYNTAAINCVDSFTIKPPLAAATPGGATVTQTNEYALAFSDAAVTSMVAARAGYFDISGNALEANPGVDAARPIMFGPATDMQEANGISNQMAPLYNGAGIQWGVADSVMPNLVVPPAGHTTSVWGLWYRRERATSVPGRTTMIGPIAPVIFYGPDIRFTMDTTRNYVNVIGVMGYAINYSGTIDTDLQLSTP